METTAPRFAVVENEVRGWGVHDSLTTFTAWWGQSGEEEVNEWTDRLNGDPDLYENLSWQDPEGSYINDGEFADAVRAARATQAESAAPTSGPRFVLDTEYSCVHDTLTGWIAHGLGSPFVVGFNRDPECVYGYSWNHREMRERYLRGEEYRPVVEAALAAASPTWETILATPAAYQDRLSVFYDAWKAWRMADGVGGDDTLFRRMWDEDVLVGLDQPGNALSNLSGWLTRHPEHIPSTLAPAATGPTTVPMDYADVLNADNLEARDPDENRALLEPLRAVHYTWLREVRNRSAERATSIQEGAYGDPGEHTSHFGLFREWLDRNPGRVPRLSVSSPAARKPEPWEEHFNSEDDWRTFYLAVNHRGNASEQCQVLDKLVKSMHGITRDQMGTIKRRVTLPELVIEVEAPFTAGNSHFGGTSVEQRIAEEVRRRVAQLEQERIEDNNPDPLPPHPLFTRVGVPNLTAEQVAPFEADLREFARAVPEMASGISASQVGDILVRPSRWTSTMPLFGYWLRVKESTDPLGPFGHLFKSREAYFAYWKKAWKLAKRAGQDREYAQIAMMMGGPQADKFKRVFKVKVPADFVITIEAGEDETIPTSYTLRDQVYTALAGLQPSAYEITTVEPTF